MSVLDENGALLCRWDAALAHGIWVDSQGDIYLALPNALSVHKYVKQG